MEYDRLLLLVETLFTKYKNNIYYEIIVTDDDTKIKKYVSHPLYVNRGCKNCGGCLPLLMIEPSWFADPTHRAKYVVAFL